MTLLDFARGPAMQVAIAIFVFGFMWRLVGLILIRNKLDLSTPRRKSAWVGGVRGLWVHLWPYKPFQAKVSLQYAVGYVFHLGIFIVLLLYGAHILFFKDIIGFGWPALPNGVITVVALVTIVALGFTLVKRLTDPVLRRISNFDDYATWLVTILPLLTGLAAKFNMWPVYETGLAIHLLSVWLLLIYFPFGKLMHAAWFAVSRYTTGVRFERRGGLV